MCHTIRQLEERHVSVEIKLMRWNDRMDLLALANIKGEVSLHRLTWQKVWCLRPELEDTTIEDMTWRPDGKILAVCYSTGNVALVQVENKTVIHIIDIGHAITCVDWLQDKNAVVQTDFLGKSQKETTDILGDSSIYLMDLPSLSSEFSTGSGIASESCADLSFLRQQRELDVLLVGTETGCVHVSVFGLFTCAVVEIGAQLGKECRVLRTHMSDDLSTLMATVLDESGVLHIAIVDASALSSRSVELLAVAGKHVRLTGLLAHLEHTMTAVTEAWESILLEMDSKLSKYASNVPDGAVCADFLDLLMFGITSDEMEEFLMQDLTDKGLKKLGHSIELSYSNIQKLLLTHVNTAGQNVTFHLSELRGMARLARRYQDLGICEARVTAALRANGAFLAKAVEVQQVINHSMANYKAFFRWLYVVILRLMDEQVPPEIPKMTQQDLLYITEFLQNFDSIGRQGSNRFNLERLGQYLLDTPLSAPPDRRSGIWSTFLEENECLRGHGSLLEHDDRASLVQQQRRLCGAVRDIFEQPRQLLSSRLAFRNSVQLGDAGRELYTSQLNRSDGSTLMCFLDGRPPADGAHLLQLGGEQLIQLKTVYLHCSRLLGEGPPCKFLDVQFYTNTCLSLLVSQAGRAFLLQLNVATVLEHATEKVGNGPVFVQLCSRLDVTAMPGLITKAVEGMTASSFAVSGSRHVSVVLSDTRHKVQLFEMEADEEEEEDDADMTVNSTHDGGDMPDDFSTLHSSVA